MIKTYFPLHLSNFIYGPIKVYLIVYWILHNRALKNDLPTIFGVWLIYCYLIGIISLANQVLKQHTQHMQINATISRHIFHEFPPLVLQCKCFKKWPFSNSFLLLLTMSIWLFVQIPSHTLTYTKHNYLRTISGGEKIISGHYV